MPPSSWTSSMSASPSMRKSPKPAAKSWPISAPLIQAGAGGRKEAHGCGAEPRPDEHLSVQVQRQESAKSERRISAMANICATFPEFNHLRLIKERFDRIYTAPDRKTAEAYCKEWAELIPPSGCRQIEAWKKRFEVEPELFDDLRSAKNTPHEEVARGNLQLL